MNILKSLILLCGGANLGIVSADPRGGVSEEKKSSDLLRIFRRPETTHQMMHTLHAGRRQLVEGKSFQLFAKSSNAKSDKADSAKSAKAYSKGQKENDSSCSDVQAELDAYKATATEPHWLFVQMADTCTLYRDNEGVPP